MFIREYLTNLFNGFKLFVNEFNLRRHGIANQSTFRCSLWFDEKTKKQNEEEIVNVIISLHLKQQNRRNIYFCLKSNQIP